MNDMVCSIHGQVHLKALKWVSMYLNDSLICSLKYTTRIQKESALKGFVDPDYADNIDTRKSLSDFVLILFKTTIILKTNNVWR